MEVVAGEPDSVHATQADMGLCYDRQHIIAWVVKFDVMVLLTHLQALHVVLLSIMGC